MSCFENSHTLMNSFTANRDEHFMSMHQGVSWFTLYLSAVCFMCSSEWRGSSHLQHALIAVMKQLHVSACRKLKQVQEVDSFFQLQQHVTPCDTFSGYVLILSAALGTTCFIICCRFTLSEGHTSCFWSDGAPRSGSFQEVKGPIQEQTCTIWHKQTKTNCKSLCLKQLQGL